MKNNKTHKPYKGNLKKPFLQALSKSMGIISTACDKVGISRYTYYQWYEQDKDFKKLVDEVFDRRLDFAESKLHELIEGVIVEKNTKGGNKIVYQRPPDFYSINLLLTTLGKKRGFVKKEEIEHIGQVSNIPQAQINIINTKKEVGK